MTLATRSTYAVAPEVRRVPEARRVSFSPPIPWPIEVVSPAQTSLLRDGAGQVTDILVPEGSELVVTSTQRVRVGEPVQLQIPLVGGGALELVVVSGGDGAQIEPAESLGLSRYIGYSASAQITEDEGARFGAWRVGQPLRQQYLLVRRAEAFAGAGFEGRLTTKSSRSRPMLIALVVAVLGGSLLLFLLRQHLAGEAEEEASRGARGPRARDCT